MNVFSRVSYARRTRVANLTEGVMNVLLSISLSIKDSDKVLTSVASRMREGLKDNLLRGATKRRAPKRLPNA